MILRGQLPADKEWDVMIDLFIARDIETIRSQQEQIKREEEEEKNAIEGVKADVDVKPATDAADEDW